MAKIRKRILSRIILKAVRSFPSLVLTGPRQSGKTTLLKDIFASDYNFVNLEDADVRIRAKDDPRAFLAQYKPPVILDEIQYAPELLSYIKTRVDENRRPGQWILSGSQNFALMQNITQSLAGRCAVLSLLPFSVSEAVDNAARAVSVLQFIKTGNFETGHVGRPALDKFLLKGFYPEVLLGSKIDRELWLASYVTTYLERDVRNLMNLGDLGQFERFLRLCCAKTGGIINQSEMARDIGVSVPTVRRWLSVLEASYQIYLLYPYYRNIKKQIVKSPKLYVTDTGIGTYLVGLNDKNALFNGPSMGNLFETMVVCDFLKRFTHFGQKPSMYYLRTRDGLEVDLVIELGGKIHLIEIKSSMTITTKHVSALKRLRSELGSRAGRTAIISRSEESFIVSSGIVNIGWADALVL